MMLGSRFSVGAEIPRGIPADLEASLREVESGLTEAERAHLRWTLTWLEGKPVLTLDNGVSLGHSGHADS